MFNFTLQTEINAPLDFVMDLYKNRNNLAKWQRGFISDERFNSGKTGIQYKLSYKAGKRNIKLRETVIDDHSPKTYEALYAMKGMRNHVKNNFESIKPDVTLWNAEHAFTFRWLMFFIGPYMKRELEQQQRILMSLFKMFAESEYENNERMRQ